MEDSLGKWSKDEVLWFPRHIQALDDFANYSCVELDHNHPGFHDEEYTTRRKMMIENAQKYKHGQSIPRVEYNKEETKTWGVVFHELTKLYPTHACTEFNIGFNLLEKNCGYSADKIPQLEDVSQFMRKTSGFRLRPVAGFISARDFLAGLAFRVFPATQFIRHSSYPFYTPEPDICHELLGHVALLCDHNFAQFSQEIGLASLGVSDDCIQKLAALYMYTVEFGLCKQDGKIRAYGAGLLSSYKELQHSLSGQAEVLPFNPAVASIQKYDTTYMQTVYFCASSFLSAKDEVIEFAKQLPRPFSVCFNPYTESVEVIKDKNSMQKLIGDIKHLIVVLQTAIDKLN